MDRGHELTDKELNKLERRIAKEYKTAVDDMQVKLRKYLEKTEAQRQVQEKLLNAGKITKEEYKNWCYRHNMVGKRWTDMLDTLTQDMHNANKIALKMTKETMPDVYALNHNFGVYQIEHDGQINTGLTLYNHDTAEHLLGDQRQLMPRPSTKKAAEIAANKDMQWNMRKIQSAVLQGVLQGENPNKVAERLRSVGKMNESASVRYARTMTTSAQNAGRYEAIHRAARRGVEMTIEWMATLDSHTRHDHRLMHGQRTEVDKPFHTPDGYTIYYPADCTGESTAPQHEIWNCRCTLLPWVKGFEPDAVKSAPGMGDLSFEEWQNMSDKEIRAANKPFTSAESPVRIKGKVSDQNTGKITSFNPTYDYSIKIGRYSDEVNKTLSDEAKRLAELGTRDEKEWLSLVNLSTGKVEYSKPGDIDMTETNFWDYLNAHDGDKFVFIHNHVLDGSISVADLEVLTTSSNLDCMIAIRNDSVKYVAPMKRNVKRPDRFFNELYNSEDEEFLIQCGVRDYIDGYFEHDGRI